MGLEQRHWVSYSGMSAHTQEYELINTWMCLFTNIRWSMGQIVPGPDEVTNQENTMQEN